MSTRKDLEGRLPIVYNGKPVEEWYSLYCQAVTELQKLRKDISEGSKVVMKRPPWTCGDCGTPTVTTFHWVHGSWEAVCSDCGNIMTS